MIAPDALQDWRYKAGVEDGRRSADAELAACTERNHALETALRKVRRDVDDDRIVKSDTLLFVDAALAAAAPDCDYSPAFQDAYQRLWHEAAERARGLQEAMETILDLTDPSKERTNRWEVAHEISFAALDKHRARPAAEPDHRKSRA